jgi:hypothetical protein
MIIVMVKKALASGLFGIGILMVMIILAKGVSATDPPENLCLIIVSGSMGYSSHETGKAMSFYDHLIDTSLYGEDDIAFLAEPTVPHVDGSANITNIENAFEWLINYSEPITEVTIYIYDHQQFIDGNVSFSFEGGNITLESIASWVENITCESITVILNGERSGLGGEILSGSNRDIICSMGSNQYYDPDNFNITRSLEDPTADLDSNGLVDYIEAFTREVELLQGFGQDPIYYQGP